MEKVEIVLYRETFMGGKNRPWYKSKQLIKIYNEMYVYI